MTQFLDRAKRALGWGGGQSVPFSGIVGDLARRLDGRNDLELPKSSAATNVPASASGDSDNPAQPSVLWTPRSVPGEIVDMNCSEAARIEWCEEFVQYWHHKGCKRTLSGPEVKDLAHEFNGWANVIGPKSTTMFRVLRRVGVIGSDVPSEFSRVDGKRVRARSYTLPESDPAAYVPFDSNNRVADNHTKSAA